MLLIVLTGLILRPYTDLNFKWREFATITPFLLVNEIISMRILKILWYSHVEEHSEPSQVSKIDIFARIINSFELTMINIFAKGSIAYMDVNIKI